MIFIHALGREMAQFVGNASQQRFEISEHTGREINTPSLQAGKGKFGFVRMKTVAHFQKFLVFQNDHGQAFTRKLRSPAGPTKECYTLAAWE